MWYLGTYATICFGGRAGDKFRSACVFQPISYLRHALLSRVKDVVFQYNATDNLPPLLGLEVLGATPKLMPMKPTNRSGLVEKLDSDRKLNETQLIWGLVDAEAADETKVKIDTSRGESLSLPAFIDLGYSGLDLGDSMVS